MGVRPTYFQMGTIIIILGLPIESNHRSSSPRLLRTFSFVVISQVWAEWEKLKSDVITLQEGYFPGN